MQNVELKAELRDEPIAREVCLQMGGTLVGTMLQTDTYYRVPSARLKKREIIHLGEETSGDGQRGGQPQVEYIFYDRPNSAGAKVSRFTLYNESGFIERFGASPLPELVRVEKLRTLYMIANTRVHMDTVKGLGKFIEFEYFVSKANTREAGYEFLRTLRHAFRFAMGEVIDRSYSDLLAPEM
jgi:adenylate cyclase class IV